MLTDRIRRDLEQFKVNLDALDKWLMQTLDIVYEIEDELLEENNALFEKIKWMVDLYNKRMW